MRHAFSIPNSLYFFAAFLFIILNSIWHRTVVIIEVHDTMIVATKSSYLLSLTVLFLIFWIVYSVGHASTYSVKLVWLHFFLCITSALILTGLMASEWMYTPRRYFVGNKARIICIVIFASSQFVFLVNMIVGITRKLLRLGSPPK